MKTEDFKEFKKFSESHIDLFSSVRRNIDEEGNPLQFSQVSQFLFRKAEPLLLGFKYTSYPAEPFKHIRLFKSDSLESRFNAMTFEDLPLAHADGIPIELAKAKDLKTIYTTLCRTREAQEFFAGLDLSTVALMEVYKNPPQVVNRDAVNLTDKAVVFYNQYRPEEYSSYRSRHLKKYQAKNPPALLKGMRLATHKSLPARVLLSSSSSSSLSSDPPLHSDRAAIISSQSFPPVSSTNTQFSCCACRNFLSVEFRHGTEFSRITCPRCTRINLIVNPISTSSTELDLSMLMDIDRHVDEKKVRSLGKPVVSLLPKMRRVVVTESPQLPRTQPTTHVRYLVTGSE
jgi:hypothetical protein